MSSFQSFLHVSGKKYEILYSDLHVGQALDELGRPASPTFGGIFTVKLNMFGQDDPTLADWMFSPTKIMDGKVVLKRIDSNATLKVIKFYNAYCVGMDMHFDGTANASFFTVTLRISPEQIDIGGLFHDNKWPDESPVRAIADEDEVLNRPPVAEVSSPQAEEKKEEPGWFSELAHTALDVVGMIPIVGEIADGANALLYAAEGDYAGAAMAAAAMIPLAGNVVGAAKLAKRALKVADKVSDAVKGPLKKLLKVCGDPVDVASGAVLAESVDFTLPGPIPLAWERTWFSSSTYQGALGHGWCHAYEWAIIAVGEDGSVGVRDGEGRLVAFEGPTAGGKGVQSERLALFLDLSGHYRIWHMDELRWYNFGVAQAGEFAVLPLQSIQDPNGFSIRFVYSAGSALQSINDSAGRVLRVETDSEGRILAIYSPQTEEIEAFALVRYEYDPAGNLVVAVDAEEHRMGYRYADHQLVQRTSRTGVNWHFRYESSAVGARCVRTWGDGDLLSYSLRYDSDSQTTTWDSYEQPTVYTHQNGLVVRQVDALGGEQVWTYSEAGQLLSEQDALGGTTLYEYDDQGRLISIATSDGSAQSMRYNEYGLPETAVNAVGGQWQWVYDNRSNLLQQTNPVDATTRYEYDEQGRLVTVIDPLGELTRLRYDQQHNVAHLVTPNEAILSQNYDDLGRLISLTDVDGSVQRRQYDRLGQLTDVDEADGTRRHLTYDPSGNVTEARQGEQQVQFIYTALGQLKERRQADQQLQFTYDREGRLTELFNEAGLRYRFGLDATGHVVEEEGFDGSIRRYERDALGQVTRTIRPSGQATQYRYNAGGQIAQVIYHDDTQEHYTYDAAGAMTEARNDAATISIRRDAMSRIIGEAQNDYRINSIYNGLGQRTALQSSLGADLSLGHDVVGNVTRMRASGWQAQFGYDSRGLEVQRQLSGGIQMNRRHNTQGRLAEQRMVVGESDRRRTYQWQGASQLGSVEDSRLGNARFEHDVFGNLTQATYNDGRAELRLPDAVGNLFESADKQDRNYGPSGQLLSTAKARYEYDAEGNLSRKVTNKGETWQYHWNGAGLLQAVVRPDAAVVSFLYDALGRRISKTYKGKVTHWVWDGDKPLHEWQSLVLDGQNTDDVITWLFEENSFAPIARLQGQQRNSILTDHLGTPLEMISQQGATTWSAETTPFGRVRLLQGTRAGCPFRFPGQYEDVETGLYYNRARYYDPETGAYISQDPLRLLSGEPNLYAYVQDPTRFMDVLGLHGAELGNVADSILYHIKIGGETFKYGIGTEKFVLKSDISIRAPDGTTKIIPKGTSTRLYQQLRKAYSNFDDVVVDITKHTGISTADMRDIEDKRIQSYFERRGKVPSGNTGHAVGGRKAEDLFGGISDLKKHLTFKCNL